MSALTIRSASSPTREKPVDSVPDMLIIAPGSGSLVSRSMVPTYPFSRRRYAATGFSSRSTSTSVHPVSYAAWRSLSHWLMLIVMTAPWRETSESVILWSSGRFILPSNQSKNLVNF